MLSLSGHSVYLASLVLLDMSLTCSVVSSPCEASVSIVVFCCVLCQSSILCRLPLVRFFLNNVGASDFYHLQPAKCMRQSYLRCRLANQNHQFHENYMLIEQDMQTCYHDNNLVNFHCNRGGAVASWSVRSTLEPGSRPGLGHCVVFLGKTLYSHSAYLLPGV